MKPMTQWEKQARCILKELTYLNWEGDDALEGIALGAHLLLWTPSDKPIPNLDCGQIREILKKASKPPKRTKEKR